MPNVLTREQIAAYERDGFLFPIDVYTRQEAAELSRKLEEVEAGVGHELQLKYRIKAHLPFPWLCDVVRSERLLDAVEDIIGPNILCWGASFFAKKAHDPRFISWHTDSFYYNFEPPETLSAWVSFNDATAESGCVRYIPGSHKWPAPQHEFRPHPHNLAGDGRTVVGLDERHAVDAVLKAGQVVFHHESVIHCSGPNNASHPRVGFVIHYVAPCVRDRLVEHPTAMLVRGTDPHGYWGRDPEPAVDFDPECIRLMEQTRAQFKAAQARKVQDGVVS